MVEFGSHFDWGGSSEVATDDFGLVSALHGIAQYLSGVAAVGDFGD